MRRLIAVEHLTLDGVMQAPARPDEDVRGGFVHGGWAAPFADASLMTFMRRDGGSGGEGGMLFGRRTYEDFFKLWPGRTDNPYTEVLNRQRKYVVSRTLQAPLAWQNSVLLRGEAVQSVAALKREGDGDLVILGSGALVRSLSAAGLIDRFVLTINPLVLGSGQRLFEPGLPRIGLRLVKTEAAASGAIMAAYDVERA